MFEVDIPVADFNRSSNASAMFALNRFLCPASAELRSVLIDPISFDFRLFSNPILNTYVKLFYIEYLYELQG